MTKKTEKPERLTICGVSNSFICVDTKNYKTISLGKKYKTVKTPIGYERTLTCLQVFNDYNRLGLYPQSCFKQINDY